MNINVVSLSTQFFRFCLFFKSVSPPHSQCHQRQIDFLVDSCYQHVDFSVYIFKIQSFWVLYVLSLDSAPFVKSKHYSSVGLITSKALGFWFGHIPKAALVSVLAFHLILALEFFLPSFFRFPLLPPFLLPFLPPNLLKIFKRILFV